MHICVYCASSQRSDPEYRRAAYQFGALAAKAEHTIVYGGGSTGSMGALAEGALAEGGEVIGITPQFMADLEWSHKGLSELVIVDNMRERKHLMLQKSDAIVALPGGTGTLDELMETVTLKKLAVHGKPIVLLNTRHYYEPIVNFMQHMIDERFMHPKHADLWQMVDMPEQILPAIEHAPTWDASARNFAVFHDHKAPSDTSTKHG